MTGKMQTYYYKVIIGLAVFAIIGAGLWLYKRYETIKASVFEARRLEIAAHIQNRAATLIKPEAFNNQDPMLQRQAFEAFFDAIQTPEIFRIKVFDRQPKIIWSNLKEIIGQDASSNREAIDALNEGKITLKFKSLKPEQVSERQFQEFTETYIPIQDAKGKVVGAIEVYQTAIRARENINGQFQKLAMITMLVVLVGYSGIALVLRFFIRPARATHS